MGNKEHQAYQNTDTEIYRGPSRCEWGDEDRFYADSLHITKEGALGINCGGYVIVRPIREWFSLAKNQHAKLLQAVEMAREIKPQETTFLRYELEDQFEHEAEEIVSKIMGEKDE